MKDDSQVQIAWQIWHLIGRLNDLIWDHYEKDFLEIVKKEHDPTDQNDEPPF